MTRRHGPQVVCVVGGFGIVLLGLVGCSSQDESPAPGPADEAISRRGTGTSTFDCTVAKGVDEHDDVAKFSFKMTGLGTAKTTFVKTGWKVSDKGGHDSREVTASTSSE